MGGASMMRERLWRLAEGRSLPIGRKALIMGVLNVTPDSFSDGGRYDGDVGHAVESGTCHGCRRCVDHRHRRRIDASRSRAGRCRRGAAARPAAIRALRARSEVAISIDTYRAETAMLAIEAGASIVNDVWGAQKDPAIAEVAARTGAGLCLMHTGRERQKLPDVIADQRAFLGRSIEIARAAGVADERIVLDPGFGFAKSADENFELMMRIGELVELGFRSSPARRASASCAVF